MIREKKKKTPMRMKKTKHQAKSIENNYSGHTFHRSY